MNKKQEQNARVINDFIPDYDYLFEQNGTDQKPKKKGFFTKILMMNKGSILFSVLVYLLQTLPVWVTPILTADIINTVVNAIQVGQGVTAGLIQYIAIRASIILVLIFLNNPTTILRYRIVSKMNRRTSAGIKASVVRKLQHLSITYHKDIQSGRIQSKFLKDTESIDMLLSNFMHGVLPSIINIIIATSISIYNNGIVSLFFLLVIPINVLLTKFFRNKLRQNYRDYRIKTEDLSAKMSTMLEMLPVTKSHGLEQTEITHFDKKIKALLGSGLEVDKKTANFGSWVYVVHAGLGALCVVFCCFLALNGTIGVGDIILYQSMFNQISNSVTSLTNLVPTIASGSEALNSVSEIMNETDVETSLGKRDIMKIEGNITFDNVSYHYPDGEQDVLHNFSLNVKKGECIAVVGSSGSGKTTLMNLIIGFMMPNSGRIMIDDSSIADLNLSEYRHHISVVPQNSILFPGSIKENITYGIEKYSKEDLDRAVEMANLNEFLKELPDGIETQVGEHGGKLSGGQRQRITIARALIRNPKILILDEATSALDNISEFHVQKAISSSIRGRTTFIVAHRLSTIRDADRIVVLEQGEMVECGTYAELMAKKGKFYKLKELNELNLKTAEQGLA